MISTLLPDERPETDGALVTGAQVNTTNQPVDFLSLLPWIRRYAGIRFRRLPLLDRQEVVAETIARAFVFYKRLIDQGKTKQIAAAPLADYAARQVRCGRRVGTRANVQDVSSWLCQMKHGITRISLDQRDEESDAWQGVLVEDQRTTPAEIAITRIDFRTWLTRLPPRQRHVAEVLATGESTTAASLRFGVTRGRISQLRAELRDSWLSFQGELPKAVPGAA